VCCAGACQRGPQCGASTQCLGTAASVHSFQPLHPAGTVVYSVLYVQLCAQAAQQCTEERAYSSCTQPSPHRCGLSMTRKITYLCPDANTDPSTTRALWNEMASVCVVAIAGVLALVGRRTALHLHPHGVQVRWLHHCWPLVRLADRMCQRLASAS
jgi:hypothetical protein